MAVTPRPADLATRCRSRTSSRAGRVRPGAITIAEDVSGMPTLGRPVAEVPISDTLIVTMVMNLACTQRRAGARTASGEVRIRVDTLFGMWLGSNIAKVRGGCGASAAVP